MDPQRWSQARSAFENALDRPPEAREAYLAEIGAVDPGLRAEVEALLKWHAEAGGFLEEPPTVPDGLFAAAPAAPLARVGPYRVTGPLGEGGMGQVFRAVRSDDAFRKEVAVKVLGAGMARPDLAARFRAERQILAQLEHPNIARLLDGGTTEDGRPYLVMELVEGVPIDRYCQDAGLDLTARLRLFFKVCAAVRFAHQNLVVHRDLKPGNILVGADGEPKLLDFGIAKILQPESLDLTVLSTATGLAPLTPLYASPEQVSGKPVTVLSDVYALGVLLYELLTGHRPCGEGVERLDEVVRAICEVEPALPSRKVPAAQGRRLVGDLDNILLKALRKEPERRYSSVDELVRDLENHLAGWPVAARPDTFFYRGGKFIRRHRLGTAATAAFVLFLTGFLIVLLIQRRELLERQRLLVEQRNRSEAVSQFLTNVFSSPDPYLSSGETTTARELLDQGARRVDHDLAAHPEARADLLLTMARSYKNLGLYAQARPLVERAVEERQRLGKEDSEEMAESLFELAEIGMLDGHLAEAETLIRRSLALRQRLHGEADGRVLANLGQLARILELRGDWRGAAREHERALALARRHAPPQILAKILDRSAILQSQLGKPAAAEAMFREALSLERRLWGDRHPEVALTRNNLALLLLKRGRLPEAEALFEEARRTQLALFQGPHPHLATTLNNFGMLRAEQGRFEDAERLYQESITMARAAYRRADHPRIAATLQNLGDLQLVRGRIEDAERLYREALAMRRRTLPPGHSDIAASLNNLGRALAARKEVAEAEAAFEEALGLSRAAAGEDHPQVAAILNNLADLRQERHDLAGAEELYRQAIGIVTRSLGNRHPDLISLLNNLGNVQRERGELEAARESLRQVLPLAESTYGRSSLQAAMTRLNLAFLEEQTGNPRAAEALALSSLKVFSAHNFPREDPWVDSVHDVLKRCRAALEAERVP